MVWSDGNQSTLIYVFARADDRPCLIVLHALASRSMDSKKAAREPCTACAFDHCPHAAAAAAAVNVGGPTLDCLP